MTAKKLPEHSINTVDGVHVLLRDGVVMKTPRSLDLAVPLKTVADAVLAECQAQKQERLDLRSMPMTQMLLTVLDVTAAKRGEIIDNILRYGDSELVCQRASDPAELVSAQNEGWQPYLDWCRDELGADLLTGNGIVPFKQNEQALAALRVVIDKMDDYRLTGLSEAVGVSGSLVLGLALATGRSTAAQVYVAAELDQLWQNKKWGQDEEAAARQAAVKADLEICERWLSFLSSNA